MLMEVGLVMPKFVCLIPCRLNSIRLPNKALLKLGKYTLIETVCRNVIKSFQEINLECDVFVCTDSDEIHSTLKKSDINIPCLITSSDSVNGTERIAEAYVNYGMNYDYIIDVQGDEPFVSSNMIKIVSDELLKYSSHDQSIVLPHQIVGYEEAKKESIVKLITDNYGKVIYITRSLVPFAYKSFSKEKIKYKKHLSVIGFTKSSLMQYHKLKRMNMELIEDIELLRAIENNMNIISPFSNEHTFSIDTHEDFLKANSLIGYE